MTCLLVESARPFRTCAFRTGLARFICLPGCPGCFVPLIGQRQRCFTHASTVQAQCVAAAGLPDRLVARMQAVHDSLKRSQACDAVDAARIPVDAVVGRARALLDSVGHGPGTLGHCGGHKALQDLIVALGPAQE